MTYGFVASKMMLEKDEQQHEDPPVISQTLNCYLLHLKCSSPESLNTEGRVPKPCVLEQTLGFVQSIPRITSWCLIVRPPRKENVAHELRQLQEGSKTQNLFRIFISGKARLATT